MVLPLFCLLLGAFCIGTTELVVAGILPAIATDLGVSIPQAGLLISGYAIGVAIGGPVLMSYAGRWPGKRGIVIVLSIFFVAHLFCAAAPNFALLMAGRAVAAAAHGCFFGFALVLATSSVPPERRGMALSVILGGIGLANIVGVPLGTAVGNAFGWRATFVMIAVFTLIAALAIAAFVPEAGTASKRPPLGSQVRELLNRRILTGYGMIVLQMTAFFGLISFIAPYLAEVAGIGPDQLPAVLLMIGVAGAVGMFAGGWLTDLNPDRSLVIGYAVGALATVVVWLAMPRSPAIGITAMAVASAVGSLASLAVQHRVLAAALRAPELASTLMSSVFNIGIALGASLGAWAIAAGVPITALPLIGVVTLAAATLAAILSLRGDRRGG